MAEPVFKDLDGLVRSLRGDLFARWMRRAQKQALIEWRDRTEPPGLMARFERAGIGFYSFSARSRPRRGGYYVRTGALREQLRRRRPLAKNKRGVDVVTVFKYGGGALNFLTDKKGIKGVTRQAMSVSVTMPATTRSPHSYLRQNNVYPRAGGPVRAYTYTRTTTSTTGIPASTSYAAEFGAFLRDAAWIRRRSDVLFSIIARKASVDRRTGGIKSSVLEGLDDGR